MQIHARTSLRDFLTIRAADEIAIQMLNVALGWRVYAATHSAMSLAYVGLAQFLPNTALVLWAGQAADRFDRGKLMRLALAAEALALGAFAVWSANSLPSARPAYLLLIVLGSARAFFSPAMSATLPGIVDAAEFPRAAARDATICQISMVAGPAIGGVIYGFGGAAVFVVIAALFVLAALLVGKTPSPRGALGLTLSPGPLAGLRYVRRHRLLLSLISLDLLAVLLGGVTALLPIYARDILRVGPIGLGCLRCAPGVGAALVGLGVAHRAMKRHAGRRMLVCVAGFGVATAVFALSANFWLSLAALAAAGGFDMVSMVVRQTLVQLSTPDEMRGRVSAVNGLFVGASSELGEFESGATAALFGSVPAALIGGLGTLAVVALWAVIFPELRAAGSGESLYAKRSGEPRPDACAPQLILVPALNQQNSGAKS